MSKSKAFLQLIADNPPPCVEINDPELFFPTYSSESLFQEKQAKAVCRKCPLIADCLEFALDTGDQFAIMAGTTPADRDRIRHRRNETAAREERRAA
jgi:WhiB family redox-sensing transcriptional regulator